MSNYLLEHGLLQKRLDEMGGQIVVPALPDIYMRLREIIQSPQGDSRKASEVLSQDPSLVMKILKTVNSAAYGLKQPVNRVEQAVSLLGFREVSHLVLAATVIRQFDLNPGDRVMNLRKFWEHSMGVAVFTRILLNYSRKMKKEAQEEAFVGGLIHDVGKIIMYQAYPKEYTQALNLCKNEQKTITQAEEKIFGFTHQDMGAYVADEWGFSRHVVKALEMHNIPQNMDSDDMSFPFVSLIHIANILSHFMSFGNSGDPFLPVFYSDCYGAIGLKVEDIALICKDGQSAFQDVGSLLT